MPEVESSSHPAISRAAVRDSPVLAVDVGGTSVKGAVLTAGGVVAELVAPTFSGGADPDEAIFGVLDGLLARARDGGLSPSTIGLAVPGLLNTETGVVAHAANLGWSDLPLRDLVSSRTGLRTALINDARAAALAEQRWGVAADGADFIMVAIGTGVGGSVVSAGRILDGWRRAAGEIGHVIAVPGGASCGCGQSGCVEAYASGPAVVHNFERRTGSHLTAREVANLAEAGDPDAVSVWSEAADALGYALSGAIAATDPELIVLTGGVSGAGGVLTDPLQEALVRRLGARPLPSVRLSAFGAHAARTGAALAAWLLSGTAAETIDSIDHAESTESTFISAHHD